MTTIHLRIPNPHSQREYPERKKYADLINPIFSKLDSTKKFMSDAKTISVETYTDSDRMLEIFMSYNDGDFVSEYPGFFTDSKQKYALYYIKDDMKKNISRNQRSIVGDNFGKYYLCPAFRFRVVLLLNLFWMRMLGRISKY